jgi:hypothetical protein
MANTRVDTGHGGTITFATSARALNWLTIDPGERSRPPIDITHLASTTPTYMVGDLEEPGEMTVTFQWDPAGSTAWYATSTVTETVTITWPVAPGGTTAATYAGTGMVTRIKFPTLQTNQVQTGELTVKWAGGTTPSTPPVWTAGN